MKTTTIAIMSDEHVNSPVGLAPKGQWLFETGGKWEPSFTQGILRKQLDECIGRVAYANKKSSKRIFINAGDAVDMNKHDPVPLITNNGNEAVRMASSVFDGALKGMGIKKKDPKFFIRGTESHVGSQAKHEESLARDIMGVVPDMPGTADNEYKDGRYTHLHLRLSVYDQLIEGAHQGPAPGRREWTLGNSLYHELRSIYYKCLENKQPIPRVVFWGHYHTFVHRDFEGRHGKIDGFTLPGFTTKDAYAIRSTKAVGLAHIGMLILRIAEDGTLEWECPRLEYQQTPVRSV